MNKSFDIFNWQRFVRVFLNDLTLLQARRIGFATLGLVGIGLIAYLSNASEAPGANQEVALVTFAILLIGGGQIFTSVIFNDMHHPLERFQYLMLPCSNLERFVSRYLITAPLYLVYAIVLFKVFEFVANFAIVALFDVPAVPVLDLGAERAQSVMVGYVATHVFVYAAAIWFRSYALIKLWATSSVLWIICGVLAFLAVRIFYWDSFISFFEMNPAGPYPNIDAQFMFDERGTPTTWVKALFGAFLVWVMFLAYLGLKEHEVQDGL
jgi:hypothetical protein